MYFDLLPTETVTQIFLSVDNISSVIALSSTCRHFRHIYASSKKLRILSRAAEHEYGPIDDIVQLVTHNSSQPAHIRRTVPISEALIRSIVKAGRVAAKWETIYIFKKWKTDYENRRCITHEERYHLRRALYRLWLFTRAFHNASTPRLLRSTPMLMNERATLLHNSTTKELSQMLDVHNILRDTISNNVCPSNGTIRRKFQKRFPDSNYQLLFNTHLNFPPPPPSLTSDSHYFSPQFPNSHCFQRQNKFTPTRTHEPGAEGWGDDILHYYVVEDMLKLDPEQILWLKEGRFFKGDVERYVQQSFGDWFENNGECFVQTLQVVLRERGLEWEEFREAVLDGEMGVALRM